MKMNNKDKAMAFLGLALAYVSLAAYEYFESSHVRPTGRWSFLLGPIYDSFGFKGIVVWHLLVASLLVLTAFIYWRER